METATHWPTACLGTGLTAETQCRGATPGSEFRTAANKVPLSRMLHGGARAFVGPPVRLLAVRDPGSQTSVEIVAPACGVSGAAITAVVTVASPTVAEPWLSPHQYAPHGELLTRTDE